MQENIGILRKCGLFNGVSDSELLALLGCLGGRVSAFERKETVFSEGDKATRFGIVLSGAVQISRTDYYGNRTIAAFIGAGGLFGESVVCADADEMPVTVTAEQPCEVLFIERDRVLYPCNKGCHFHQQMIFNLMKILAAKNLHLQQKAEIIAKRTTRDKLLAYLAVQAKNAGNARFVIPFDRQGLADYLQVDRSGLSAEISKLRAEGVLRCRKNEFELL